jgi:hypothetical protein
LDQKLILLQKYLTSYCANNSKQWDDAFLSKCCQNVYRMMDVKRAAPIDNAVTATGPEALLAFPEGLLDDPLPVPLVPLFCLGSAVSL